MGDTTRLRATAALAACLLLLLLGSCTAQSLTRQIVKSTSGESVQFLGDSVALKYFPAASANCSQCYLSFKLGALSELDAVRLRPITSVYVSSSLTFSPGVSHSQPSLWGVVHAVWATCGGPHHSRPLQPGSRGHRRCVQASKLTYQGSAAA
jgi:hypothetical protein